MLPAGYFCFQIFLFLIIENKQKINETATVRNLHVTMSSGKRCSGSNQKRQNKTLSYWSNSHFCLLHKSTTFLQGTHIPTLMQLDNYRQIWFHWFFFLKYPSMLLLFFVFFSCMRMCVCGGGAMSSLSYSCVCCIFLLIIWLFSCDNWLFENWQFLTFGKKKTDFLCKRTGKQISVHTWIDIVLCQLTLAKICDYLWYVFYKTTAL